MAYGASHDDLPPADANCVDGPDRVDADPGSASAADAVPAFLTADPPPTDAAASQPYGTPTTTARPARPRVPARPPPPPDPRHPPSPRPHSPTAPPSGHPPP